IRAAVARVVSLVSLQLAALLTRGSGRLTLHITGPPNGIAGNVRIVLRRLRCMWLLDSGLPQFNISNRKAIRIFWNHVNKEELLFVFVEEELMISKLLL